MVRQDEDMVESISLRTQDSRAKLHVVRADPANLFVRQPCVYGNVLTILDFHLDNILCITYVCTIMRCIFY